MKAVSLLCMEDQPARLEIRRGTARRNNWLTAVVERFRYSHDFMFFQTGVMILLQHV